MRQYQARSTIKEVAAAAGVSTQTVSRVLNDRPDVSAETRKRVQDIIGKLAYQPSSLARSLINQRSLTLGVVTAGLRYIGSSRTLSGIAAAAEEAGYSLLLKELPSFATNDIAPIFQALLSHQVDGILWVVPEIGDNHLWIKERIENIPVPVLFLAMQPRDGISSVSTDNFSGAVVGTQHLLDCGRKKIGHISGPLGWWEAEERKRGWRETLSAAGLDPSDHQSAEGNWSSASGEQAFHQLLDTFPEMDAIFVANDQMALSVLREACRRGINIPRQLAVIGFDNIPESAYFYPSLTTIYQDLQLLGGQAVQKIVELIQARHANQVLIAESRFIQPSLVVRESSSSE